MKEIYTYKELESLIVNNVINDSFWVNSTDVNTLTNVKEINTNDDFNRVHFKNLINLGDLEIVKSNFSFFGEMYSLNKLKYIDGSFTYGAPLKSLGDLEEIKGEFRPTTNELEDLGKLRKVGGTVDLRGMVHLLDLSPLTEVGGNLNLVKSLKKLYIGLSNIKVGGRIIFWNKEPVYFVKNSKIKNGIVPAWRDLSSHEFENYIAIPNEEQLFFYNYFKESFLKSEYVDVGGMRNYIRYFIFELLSNYKSNKNFDDLVNKFSILRREYPELAQDTERLETDIGRQLNIQKYNDIKFIYEKNITWETVREILMSNSDDEFHKILKNRFASSKNLTKYGFDNLDNVISEVITLIRTYEINSSTSLGNQFFFKNKFYKTEKPNDVFDPYYYKKFYDSETKFSDDLKIHFERQKGMPEVNIKYPPYIPTIVEFAFFNLINNFFRNGENNLRLKNNLPKIGEGWISEMELYHKIKNTFYEHEVLSQGKPKWLGLQRFDIYFPKYNIAIEFQGLQHFEPVDLFGGEDGLAKAKENDRRKRELCDLNNCYLIEVLPNYNFEELEKQIKQLILERGQYKIE